MQRETYFDIMMMCWELGIVGKLLCISTALAIALICFVFVAHPIAFARGQWQTIRLAYRRRPMQLMTLNVYTQTLLTNNSVDLEELRALRSRINGGMRFGKGSEAARRQARAIFRKMKLKLELYEPNERIRSQLVDELARAVDDL